MLRRRGCRYLWEVEELSLAHRFISYVMEAREDLPVSLVVEAHYLLGHICLDLSRPRAALIAYKKALDMVDKSATTSDAVDFLNCIARCHVELGDIKEASGALDRASSIQMAPDADQRRHTHIVWANVYLHTNRPALALQALRKAWALQGTTLKEVDARPSHPGRICELMLLAKIYRGLNRPEEAMALMYRVIGMLNKYYADTGERWKTGAVRLGDAGFTLALLHYATGNMVDAQRPLMRIAVKCEGSDDTRPHVARALWFLANIRERHPDGCKHDVPALRERAKEVRSSIKDCEWEFEDEDSDEAFMRLVSGALWY
jgi:tetratricopeptide (TPR) repeat protein